MSTKLKIAEEYRDLVKDLIDTIAVHGLPETARCIYSGRNRAYSLTHKNLELSIKAFKKPAFPNSVIYTNLRKSKARRSYEHGQELLRRGLPTPKPIAWIEQKKGGQLNKSYYICIQSPYEGTLREWEKWDEAKRDKVLNAYASLLFKIHQKGIQHYDLSPGNILWTENEATHEIDFELIDLNRMSIKNRPLTQKEAFTNFRNINLVEEETARLAKIYGKVRKIDENRAVELALNALRKDQRTKKRLRHLKSLFKGKNNNSSTWNNA